MTSEPPKPSQVERALAAKHAGEAPDDPSNVEGRIPQKIARREVSRVVIKMSGSEHLLELEGDDVDLGTDLKVRYRHRLVAEFRRDAVDGWWFKSFVINEGPPYGGEGDAQDVGDIGEGTSE